MGLHRAASIIEISATATKPAGCHGNTRMDKDDFDVGNLGLCVRVCPCLSL